jgi:acid stress-induced BolA-like protein IbaG/YrbA
MTADDVTQLIRAGLPEAEVRVLSDDDTHFEALVVASEFEGRRPLQRHQLVYATLGSRMGREIHALSIQAFTPDEWRAARGAG